MGVIDDDIPLRVAVRVAVGPVGVRVGVRVAVRVGVDVPPCALPSEMSIGDALEAGATGMAAERAIRFGAEQLLLQQTRSLGLEEDPALEIQARG